MSKWKLSAVEKPEARLPVLGWYDAVCRESNMAVVLYSPIQRRWYLADNQGDPGEPKMWRPLPKNVGGRGR